MRENLNAIKRLVAFLLTVFLVGTTVWNDVFVIATEENHCSEYVDEQTYAANILQPVGEGDGYCDYCGQVEEAHIHEEAPAEEPEPEVSEETPQEETATQPEAEPEQDNSEANTEEITNTTTEETVVNDNADNSNDSNNEETPVIDKEDETETPDDEIDKKDEDEADKDKEDKEDEKDDKEDCDHKWTYESKGDGTHVKKCSECGEEVTENCIFDDEGKCTLCGYEKPKDEEEEECDHEWTYESKNNGTHIKRCKKCGEEIEEKCELDEDGKCKLCGYEDERLVYQSHSKTLFGTTVTVSGMLPRGAKVDIFYAGTKPVEEIIVDNTEETSFEAFVAFDIDIHKRSGEKYQPQEDGGTVKVSFTGVEEVKDLPSDEVTVYRIEDDKETVTEIECEVIGEDIYFEAEHFTTYAAGTPSTTSTKKLEYYENFAYVNTTGDNAYTTLTQVKFYLYFATAGTVNLTIDSYKNLESSSTSGGTDLYENPISDYNLYPTQQLAVTGGANTYQEVTVDFTPTKSTYMTRNTYYSVVVSADKACTVVYGAAGLNSYIGNADDGWENRQNGIFQGEVVNHDVPSSSNDVTIAKINSKNENRDLIAVDNYMFYYAKNDTDTFTVVFDDPDAERTVTWATGTGDDSIVKVESKTATTASITAVAKGTTTIKATYGNVTKIINISVIEFKVLGKDIDGLELDYNGSNIKASDVKGDIVNEVDSRYLNIEIKGDGSVSENAEMTITFTSPDDPSYTKSWVKNYKVNPLVLTESVFYTDTNSDGVNDKNIKMTIVGGVIQEMTGMGTVKANGTTDVQPVYNSSKKDFSASIIRQSAGVGGLVYTISIEGENNYTGSFQVDLTNSESKTEISTVLDARLSTDSELKNAVYKGTAYGLTTRTDSNSKNVGWNEVEFVGKNEVVLDGVVTSETATVTITDIKTGTTADTDPNAAITAGEKIITFTMKGTNGYKGSVSVNFTVQAVSLASSDVTIEWVGVAAGATKKMPHKANNAAVEPKGGTAAVDGTDFIVKFKGNAIDTDQYDVAYDNNTSITANARIILTGKNNFTSNRSSVFEIVADYGVDLQVILSDSKDYKATKQTDGTYSFTSYAPVYDPTLTETTIINAIKVYIPGYGSNGYVTSNYSISVTNGDGTTFNADKGVKKVVLTLTSDTFKQEFGITGTDGDITATFEISRRDISSGSAIQFDYSAPTGEVYNGAEHTITTATASSSTGKNLKVYYAAKNTILEEGVDYTIDYTDTNVNAGTARFTVTGVGNYKGTKELTSFKFNIAKKSIKDCDVSYSWPTGMDNVYDGTEKKPTVTVKIGNQVIPEYADTAKTIKNYTVTYQNNINVASTQKPATITVTAGTNGSDGVNLKESKVVDFTIIASTAKFADFIITGDNGEVHATPYDTSSSTEIWECPSLNPTYTGSEIERWVDVYVKDKNGNPVQLVKNTDFYVTYDNNINTQDYKKTSDADIAASPQIKITGRGNYAGKNAIILFNIKPNIITADDSNLEVKWTEKYDWTGSDVNVVVSKVTYKGKDLVERTDYEIKQADELKSAGEKTAQVIFKGNYVYVEESNVGASAYGYPLAYTVGLNVNDAAVTLKNPFKENDTTYCKTGTGLSVKWINGYAPKVYMNWTNSVEVTYSAGNPTIQNNQESVSTGDLIFTPARSITEIGMYDSRAAGNLNGVYNVITLTVAAKKDATTGLYTSQFYGEKVIEYTIRPASIRSINESDTPGDVDYSGSQDHYPYTGAAIPLDIRATYKYNPADSADAYTLVKGKDFTLSKDTIGPAVSSDIERVITGCGNFANDESQKTWFYIDKGTVKITYKRKATDPETDIKTLSLVAGTDTYSVEWDADDPYIYDGDAHCPIVKVTPSQGTEELTAEECEITYPEAGATSDDGQVKPGTKTITIHVKGENYVERTITLNYRIITNSIAQDGYTAVLTPVTYTATDMSPAQIETELKQTNPSIKLTVKRGTLELVRGRDYEIVTTAVINNETGENTTLKEIQAQAGYSGVTSIRGTNNTPSCGTTNWFFIKGIDKYSDYKQVFFDIQLDLSSTAYAKVWILGDPTLHDHYELNENGETTNPIQPDIYYRRVGDAQDTYNGHLDLTSTVNGAQVDNYVISRPTRAGLPGPDPDIEVIGQNACKGKKTSARYNNGTTSGSVVYFLMDLSKLKAGDITFTGGTEYPFKNAKWEVTPAGDIVEGATLARNEATDSGDYTIIYTKEEGSLTSVDAITVGKWYAKLKATSGSKYFIANTNTGKTFSFYIKYDLSATTTSMKFYPVNGGSTAEAITSISYSGTAYNIRENSKITCAGVTVYDYKSSLPSNVYFSINPATATKKGEYNITVLPDSNYKDYVCGELSNIIFTVEGLDIRSSAYATFKLYDPDSPGTECRSFTYNGGAIKPLVKGTLKDGNDTPLKENVDFTVKYYDNTNCGTNKAYVGITGIGAYATKEEFYPDDCKFSITKLNLSDSHVEIEIDEATYSGYTDPSADAAATDKRVKLTPKFTVYYVDTKKGIKNPLLEQTGTVTKGDVKVDGGWQNNTVAADKSQTTDAPTLTVLAGDSENTTGQKSGTFTINKLNLNAGSVSIDKNSHEFTGEEIDISNIVKLTATYKKSSTETVKVPLVQTGGSVADNLCDYEVTVTGPDGQNINSKKVSMVGEYSIKITGINSCTSDIVTSFTVTPRSLEDNFHYYYSYGQNPGWNGSWTYDPAKKRYIGQGKDEPLTIYVYDVDPVDENGNNVPKISITDTGRVDNNNYELKETDFTIENPKNNSKAASGEWTKEHTVDAKGGYHATVASTSPSITITGTGNYSGSITLPFDIGKNINTLGLTIKYSVPNADLQDSGDEYTYNVDDKDVVKWHYTYNAEQQLPDVSVYNGTNPVALRNYEVSYTDDTDREDSSTNAGYKYVVITGKGDYCGVIRQKYAINRKAILDTGGPFEKDPMETTNKQLTLEVTGAEVKKLDEKSINDYLVSTGILDSEDPKVSEFKNMYYAVYDGKAIEPTVRVTDHTLGFDKKTSYEISADDLNVTYKRQNQVAKFNYENGLVTTVNLAEIHVKFYSPDSAATKPEESFTTKGNYYVGTGGSNEFVINYMIIQHSIENDFSIQVLNGLNNDRTSFDSGKPKVLEILVTNGTKELEEGVDYTVSYKDADGKPTNIVPGKATLTVTGIGNYRGTKTKEFYIDGDLSLTEPYYYNSAGAFVSGIPQQQYTGEAITKGDPEIFLVLERQGSMTGNVVLNYGRQYDIRTTPGSNSDFTTDGTVVYSGIQSAYWTGNKEIEYNIKFNAKDVDIPNVKETYEYTGKPITPKIELNVSTAEYNTDDAAYYRNDDKTAQTTDFTTPGKITIELPYKIGTYQGTVTKDYEITKRNLASCQVVLAQEQRYTGRQIKPAFTAFIDSKNLQTGKAQIYTIPTSEYTVDYGNYTTGNSCLLKLSAVATSEYFTGIAYGTYNIVLSETANLSINNRTGSELTISWENDLYSDGAEIRLEKLNSSGVFEEIALDGSNLYYKKPRADGSTHVLTGLDSSTQYRVSTRSYSSKIASSEWETIITNTDVKDESITVVSNSAGTATVTWTDSGSVTLYYIYRATTNASIEDDPGQLVAIIPATSKAYTNSGLAHGTYYYYVKGKYLQNAKLIDVGVSHKEAVTVQ